MDMKQIMPIIMDTSFTKLAIIDDYISFIWTTRYYTVGDFELCVDANESNYQIFKQDYYIYREDDENVGIIEDIKIQRNEDGNEILIVKGRFLAAILARRIIAVQTTVNGSISNCINQLINENVINPSIAARKINNFILIKFKMKLNLYSIPSLNFPLHPHRIRQKPKRPQKRKQVKLSS